jgi:hypothetical protein
MQFLGNWWFGVAGLPAEDHLDSHRRDGLIGVVDDGDRKAVEPGVIFNECFAYLNVCFLLRLDAGNAYRLHAKRLPDYNPVRLLTLSPAIS